MGVKKIMEKFHTIGKKYGGVNTSAIPYLVFWKEQSVISLLECTFRYLKEQALDISIANSYNVYRFASPFFRFTDTDTLSIVGHWLFAKCTTTRESSIWVFVECFCVGVSIFHNSVILRLDDNEVCKEDSKDFFSMHDITDYLILLVHNSSFFIVRKYTSLVESFCCSFLLFRKYPLPYYSLDT